MAYAQPVEHVRKPIKVEKYSPVPLTENSDVHFGPAEITISPTGKFLCRIDADLGFITLVKIKQRKTRFRVWRASPSLAHVNSSGKYVVFKRHLPDGNAVATIYKTEERLEKVKEDSSFPHVVVFLKWISDAVVAVVTTNEVYHWSIEDKVPKKMFDRDENLSIEYTTVVNYKMDATRNLILLISFDGLMELYCVEDRTRKIIKGLAPTFAQFKKDGNQGNQEFSTLLCYAVLQDLTQGTPTSLESLRYRLHIEFPGLTDADAPAFTDPIIDIDCDPKTKRKDYPVCIHVGPKCDVIFLMTRYGFVYVYLTGLGRMLVYKERVSESEVLVTAPHEPSTGIIAVNHEGQVFSVCVNEDYTNNVPLVLHGFAGRAIEDSD